MQINASASNRLCALLDERKEYSKTYGLDCLFQCHVVKKNLKNIERLLEQGADVNSRLKNNTTLLHWAAWDKDSKFVRFLLGHGADVAAVDKYGNTALHKAAQYGCKESLALLLKHHAQVNLPGECAWTPLHRAAFKGHFESVKYLVKNGANINALTGDLHTALYWSVYQGNMEIARYLLKQDVNVTALDDEGWKILNRVHTGPHANVKEGELFLREFIELSLEKNKGDIIDSERKNLLHTVISKGHSTYAIELIERWNIDVNAQDIDGNTPLYEALIYKATDLVIALVEKGADVNFALTGWVSPLYFVVKNQQNKDLALLLIQHGAQFEITESGYKIGRKVLNEAESAYMNAIRCFITSKSARN